MTAYHDRNAGKDSRQVRVKTNISESIHLSNHNSSPLQAFVVFVQLMNQHGILKTDDLITRFFRMATQMCVDLCYRYDVYLSWGMGVGRHSLVQEGGR